MDLSFLEQTLYKDIDGYGLSSAGRLELGRADDPALTYGEVTPASVLRMLTKVDAKPGETFYDLGSGTGKAVLYSAIIGGMGKAVGIELVRDLYEAAETVRERYNVEVRPQIEMPSTIEFRHGDMFDHDLSDADIVFSHCTCFDDALMQRLAQKLEELRPGARVITVTKNVPSVAFETIGSELLSLGWGDATMYYQRRKG